MCGAGMMVFNHPLAPMCWLNADPSPGLRIAPAAKDPAARPAECIYAAAIDDSQFKVAVERRDGDVMPQRKVLSLRQSFPGLSSQACWHFLIPSCSHADFASPTCRRLRGRVRKSRGLSLHRVSYRQGQTLYVRIWGPNRLRFRGMKIVAE